MQRTPISQFDESRIRDLAAALSGCATLAGVDAPVLAQLVRFGTLVEVSAGEALIREGEPAAAEIYLLVDGALAVQSRAGFIARLDQPGAVIGEVAVLLSSARTADVVAQSAVRVIAIASETLLRPEFGDVAAGVRSSMLRDDWVRY